MTDLVVMSLERWDDVWRRNQYLISGLLDSDPTLRVLFVEPPADPLHALRRRVRPEFGSRMRRVDDRLWAVRAVKWLPRRFDPFAAGRPVRHVRRAAERLGMDDPMLWVNDPGAADVARLTGWTALYDMTDDWLSADRPPTERARVAAGERWLLQHAATVVACSPELVRRKSDQRADIVLIRNAVDVARYQVPTERPADLPAGRTAVYVGTLHRDRLDVELCVDVARGLAGTGSLVLVGPNALSDADTTLLRDSGVVLLGARSRDEVPAYLQHADVLVVPHVVSDFTESLDPIKLYEYQAVGRPVVSTPVAGFRDAAGVIIATSSTFSGKVAHAVTASYPMRTSGRRESADWSVRVQAFQDLLGGTIC